MAWTPKEHQSSFDQHTIDGLAYLDGDMLAWLFQKDWTAGQKYPVIEFPSGIELDLWETSDPKRIGIVHVFGEMDLPLVDTAENAFNRAHYIAGECGYRVRKVGDTDLEVWGHDRDEHFLLRYDEKSGRMADVIKLAAEPVQHIGHDLMTDELAEQFPPLYANEDIGMDAMVVAKYYTPDSNWTWYATEFDGEDIFFGMVSGFEVELGNFALSELQQVRGPKGLPIERDLHFEPKTLREIKKALDEGDIS